MQTLTWPALALLAAAAFSQERHPAFEVVSVKPSAMSNGGYGIGFANLPGGRFLFNMCPLEYIISIAFDMQTFRISGGPRWIHEDRWDIEAKPPTDSEAARSAPKIWKMPPNKEQRLMLQTMLADRFRFRYHMEAREGPVYFLVRTNKALKLEPSKNKDEYPWAGSVGGGAFANDGIRGTNITMAQLAARLSDRLDHPVIDRSGLEGAFDFMFKMERDDAPGGSDVPSVIMASLQALGLKLEAGKGPVETLMIDSVEKPSGN